MLPQSIFIQIILISFFPQTKEKLLGYAGCFLITTERITINITLVKKKLNITINTHVLQEYNLTRNSVSSVKRKNRKERVENKKCPHDCPLSLLTTSWFNHLSFYNFWGMGLVYRGLELTRCRPFTSESHTHHLIYLPSKLCWIIRLHTNK